MAKRRNMTTVALLDRIQEIIDLSFREGRDLNQDERAECQRLLATAQSLASARKPLEVR